MHRPPHRVDIAVPSDNAEFWLTVRAKCSYFLELPEMDLALIPGRILVGCEERSIEGSVPR